MTFGAVVVAYNLPGLSQPLMMTPDVIANLFLGKITKWNDPAIAAANPGVHATRHGRQRRPPLGWLGHHEHLHHRTSPR